MDEHDYWTSFWKSQGRASAGQQAQERVLRTSNRAPIDEQRWRRTVDYVCQNMAIQSGDTILDLCSGNGLFSIEFARLGATVTAVDISEDLLADLKKVAHPSITTRCSDMRGLSFEEGCFSHVFLYAGIQYLSHGEAVLLLRECYSWLQPGGCLLIGDIPDADKIWMFYDSPERREQYFTALAERREVIGTWYSRSWLDLLAKDVGFKSVRSEDQPEYQIYSHFRFDALMYK